MIVAFLLFLNLNHDLIINVSCCFDLVATIGTIVGLYKIKWYWLFAFGLCCLLLVPLNNYFYYYKGMIIYMPKEKNIKLVNLLVNSENPRFEATEGQKEAIDTMVEDQQENFYNLAESILNQGLNIR